MPYDVYLHRSFDYQLSPTPSTIIDWAPARRPTYSAQATSNTAPLIRVPAQPRQGGGHKDVIGSSDEWRLPAAELVKLQQEEVQRRQLYSRATGPREGGEAASVISSYVSHAGSLYHEVCAALLGEPYGRSYPYGITNGSSGGGALHNTANSNAGDSRADFGASGNADTSLLLSEHTSGEQRSPLLGNVDIDTSSNCGGQDHAGGMGNNSNGGGGGVALAYHNNSYHHHNGDGTLVQGVLQLPNRRRSISQWIASSYGSAVVYERGSLSVTVGLLTALGVHYVDTRQLHSYFVKLKSNDGGARPPPPPDIAPVFTDSAAAGGTEAPEEQATYLVGAQRREWTTKLMDVLQIEMLWGTRQWSGVLNIRLLPLPSGQHARLPLCDFSFRTPWVAWNMQSDELVLSWNGFLTLYQQNVKRQLPPKTDNSNSSNAKKKKNEEEEAATQRRAKVRSSTAATAAAAKENSKKGDEAVAKPEAVEPVSASASERELWERAGALVEERQRGPHGLLPRPEDLADVYGAHHHSPNIPLSPRPFWRLRQLKVGASITVKNDLASGINLEWGVSGQTGRGVGFSVQLDIIRRLCCSVSSSLGPLDACARMRVNLITLHQTTLDWGLCYRPLSNVLPNTVLRLACSGGRFTAGVEVEDATRQFFAWWIRAHAARRRLADSAKSSGNNNSGSDAVKEKQAQEAEGSWISFGWAATAWNYTYSGVAGLFSGGAHKNGDQKGHDTASKPPISPPAAPSHHHQQQQHSSGWAGKLMPWRPHSRQGVAGPQAGTQHAFSGRLVARAAQAGQSAAAVAGASWRAVRRLDWLETVLDGVRVDVATGITQDRRGDNFQAFLMVSSH